MQKKFLVKITTQIKFQKFQKIQNQFYFILFYGTYFHYEDVPKETMFERSIAEGITLKK